MVDVVDMVTEFLTTEGSNPMEIYRRLRSAYSDDDALDVGSGWVRSFKSGEKDTCDRSRRIRPAMAATTEAKDKVDALIGNDCRNTSGGRGAIGTGKPAVMAIMRGLG